MGEDLSPFYRFPFHHIDNVLCLTEIFKFHEIQLLIVNLTVCVVGILFRKLSPLAVRSMLFPTFSCMRFSISEFMLRFLIHLNLSFVKGDGNRSALSFYLKTSGYANTAC